jgi:hypothetical protein
MDLKEQLKKAMEDLEKLERKKEKFLFIFLFQNYNI